MNIGAEDHLALRRPGRLKEDSGEASLRFDFERRENGYG
jgi:hypothetical protein